MLVFNALLLVLITFLVVSYARTSRSYLLFGRSKRSMRLLLSAMFMLAFMASFRGLSASYVDCEVTVGNYVYDL